MSAQHTLTAAGAAAANAHTTASTPWTVEEMDVIVMLRATQMPAPGIFKYQWQLMHAAVETYADNPDAPTPEEQSAAIAYFTSLVHMHSCKERCRPHWRAYLAAHPVSAAVGSRAALRAWLVDAHNAVNVRLGKHWPVVTPRVAAAVYGDTVARCETCTKSAALGGRRRGRHQPPQQQQQHTEEAGEVGVPPVPEDEMDAFVAAWGITGREAWRALTPSARKLWVRRQTMQAVAVMAVIAVAATLFAAWFGAHRRRAVPL